jgi:hypothetical protein
MLGLICSADNTLEKTHADEFVLKLIGRELLKVGNLETMSSTNAIELEKDKYTSLPEVLRAVGLDINKCETIEGTSINSWGIERYKVSESYDLYVKFLSKKVGDVVELSSILVFVAPHQNDKFEAKLFSDKRWAEINFTIQNGPEKAPKEIKPVEVEGK